MFRTQFCGFWVYLYFFISEEMGGIFQIVSTIVTIYIFGYHSGDYRFMPKWYEHILIRTAKDTTDYKGGSNNYTNFDDFVKDVDRLFRFMDK